MMIFLILFLALLLRLLNLNQSLWLDEAIQVLAVRDFSYSSLITQYSLGDFHPPLYHLLLKFWTSLFGFSEITLRFPSIILGVATVFVVYQIVKVLGGKNLGLLAAFFFAFAPLHIYYSQEVRMYALASFLTTMSVYFFLRLLKRESFLSWILFVLSTVLLFYSEYLPWLMIVPFNLYIFWQRKNLTSGWLFRWLAAQLVVFVFLLSWLPFLLQQFERSQAISQVAPLWREVVGGFSLKAIPLTIAKFIGGRISSYNKILYGSFISLSSIIFALFISRMLFSELKNKIFLFIWLIIPPIFAWILSIFIPIYSYFRMLFILPAMYLLIAAGILSIKETKWRIASTTGVFLISTVSLIVFWSNPRFWREDWRGAVSYIEANSVGNTAIIFVSLDQTAPVKYYAKSMPFYGPFAWQGKNLQTIWLSRYVQPIFDPEDKLRKEIESAGYKKQEEKDFNGVLVWRYTR